LSAGVGVVIGVASVHSCGTAAAAVGTIKGKSLTPGCILETNVGECRR
jgi:hypothetical protein